MQLDPAEKRSVWWKGALKGAAKALVVGALIGVTCALVFQGMFALGLLNNLAPTFAGFLTTAPAATVQTWAGGLVPWAHFSVLPFVAFNAVIGSVAGLFTGGSAAVAAYHQQKHNARDEAKLMELDGRTHALEQTVATPSRHVQRILDTGPRHTSHFETAEAARKAETPATPTLH